MPSSDSDVDISLTGKGNGSQNDETGTATPRRTQRISLGTPANYYFKYMNSSRKGQSGDVFSLRDANGDNANISISGLKFNTDNPDTEASFLSMAASSTGSESSADLLNKSTLSDTTELTASNFVLVTTSKQSMIRMPKKSRSPDDDKENSSDRKDGDKKKRVGLPDESENIVIRSEQTKSDYDEGQCGSTAEKKLKLRLENDGNKELNNVLHQTSIKSASPSLRSRIRSSPASLRKFHENLKNSRMKRQLQREADTKRRLSIQGKDSLDSMHAQLKALGYDQPLHRENLSPQSTELSQSSRSLKLPLSYNAHQSPLAGSTTDDTETIDMAALDDLLDMNDSKPHATQSSSTDNDFGHTRVSTETTPHSTSRNEQISTSSLLAEFKADESEKASVSQTMSSNQNHQKKLDKEVDTHGSNSFTSESFSRDSKPGYSSPASTTSPSAKNGLTNSNPRKRMTPTKLSSTPQRIVNPQSIFSPARNTRSATKRRKISGKSSDSYPNEYNVETNGQSSRCNNSLVRSESLPDIDLSIDSDHSDNIVDLPYDRKYGNTSSSKNDDTASLGDVANLFGDKKFIDDTSFEINSSVDSHDTSHKESKLLGKQETASIEDINKIIYSGFGSNKDSANNEAFENREEEKENTSSSNQKDDLLDPRDSNMNIYSRTGGKRNSSELKESNDSASNESNSVTTFDGSRSKKSNPESALHSDTSTKSPDVGKDILSDNSDAEISDVSLQSKEAIPKSPIRLIPNNHSKPTPSKLAPSPRRVTNPKNPNSPARNTRSALKGCPPDDSKQKLNAREIRSKDHFSTTNGNKMVEIDKVLFSRKSRRSSGKKRISTRINQSVSPSQKRYQKQPVGILSSKKKPLHRRSVAFGSPEAAEYNIGSPSVSLTPMPKGRAKALFAVPTTLNDSDKNEIDSKQVAIGKKICPSIEFGMDLLVDKITVEQMNDSPELSPIMKRKADLSTFQVSSGFVVSDGTHRHEDKTVELEVGMESLLANNLKDFNEEESPNIFTVGSETGMKDNSIELTDSESIASINSKCKKYTSDFVVPFHAQRLDFSAVSETSNSSALKVENKSEEKADETVELEDDMRSLLETAKSSKSTEKNDETNEMEIVEDTIVSLLSNNDTAQSEGFATESKYVMATVGAKDDKTVELESNMLSLLEAGKSDEDTELSDKTDEMEIVEDTFLSLVSNNDTVHSRGFTEDSKNTTTIIGVEVDKTIELESNMLSLLEATKNNEGTGDKDKMEIVEDTLVSLLPKDDVKKSGNNVSKTGTETDNTVELESNMLSLLEAAKHSEDTNNNDRTNEMEIAGDTAASLALKDGVRKSGSFIPIEGDKTVELESNMLTLLEATKRNGDAGNTNKNNEKVIADDTGDSEVGLATSTNLGSIGHDKNDFIGDEIDVLEVEDGKGTRRKSLSSNRFTLNRNDQVQNLVDSFTTRDGSLVIEKSVSFCDTTEFITSLNTNSTPSDDDVSESKVVDTSLLPSLIMAGLKFEEQEGDILSDSYSRFGTSNDAVTRIVFERWGQFIEAVCREVERRIDQEGTAVSCLADLVKEDPRFYSLLQERLHPTAVDDRIKNSLDSLAQAGQRLIGYEWNSWLGTVLESFHGPLTDIQQMYANDESKLEEALRRGKTLQTNISVMNDLKTRLARRKSILRHQAAANKLEGEIELIESQLKALKTSLQQLEEEESDVSKSMREHHESLKRAKLCDDLRNKAESSHKRYVSLVGLHSWSITKLSENELGFITVGSCPQTHLKLLYGGAESGKARTIISSKVDHSYTRDKFLYVYHEPVSIFLDASSKRLLDLAQQTYAKKPIIIGEHLQKYAWLTGRLDLIAKEFQIIQRHYNGTLQRKSAGLFSFLVEFESENSTIIADFEIELTYPSFPIDVRLDLISGEQDLEVVRKTLVKNANPGFGSLSRACDIIQSFLRSKR